MGDPPGPRAAAFLDLDRTVLSTASPLVLARPLLASGLLSRSAVLRAAAADLRSLFVRADRRYSAEAQAQLAGMVEGWDVRRFAEVVDGSLRTVVRPRVYREAIDLIAALHGRGIDVVIVSASSADVVRPIARMLGADDVVASTMEVADGRFTGRVAHFVYGAAKAEAIRDLAARRGYELGACAAYSDSVTDLPMLTTVGHPVAVNPDRALRRLARQRGWEVRRFRRPVPLRHEVSGVVGATAVGLVLVLAALGRHALRRARRRAGSTG
ncbi:HAD family hydrolase [Georgenia ruanii]|uniref:HAD-IB family hydrolase n=1 Tax=Georgenia ruanii TaxID=348442 RepID=A0A7J9UYY0_9MICO|nr:HAD family hydrolase [Georgenia ruanii]MPV89836.1 HAD-IB family hydrolase [Georgenia ruanii]